MRRNLLVTAATLAALLQPEVVNAAEIKIWTARAIATVLAEIGSEFERETGHTLIVSSDLPPAFERRVTAGESFDLLISGSSPVDEWIGRGRIVAATRTEIARSGIGVEVRAGSSRTMVPDAARQLIQFLRGSQGRSQSSKPRAWKQRASWFRQAERLRASVYLSCAYSARSRLPSSVSFPQTSAA